MRGRTRMLPESCNLSSGIAATPFKQTLRISPHLSCWPTEWGGKRFPRKVVRTHPTFFVAKEFLHIWCWTLHFKFNVTRQSCFGYNRTKYTLKLCHWPLFWYFWLHCSAYSSCFSQLQALPSTLERRWHKTVQPRQAPAQQGFHTDLVPKHL